MEEALVPVSVVCPCGKALHIARCWTAVTCWACGKVRTVRQG